MQPASAEYKIAMKERVRDRACIMVSLGIINTKAHSEADLSEDTETVYFSDGSHAVEGFEFENWYATYEEDFTKADGSFRFPPHQGEPIRYKQGAVSKEIMGRLRFEFENPQDIKGLTIDFGEFYPIDFIAQSDTISVEVTGNIDGEVMLETIFEDSNYIEIIPLTMKNGQNRLRIKRIQFGIGIKFTNEQILQCSKTEMLSPITEEIYNLDFSLTVDDKNGVYNPENPSSYINFMSTGQKLEFMYGQTVRSGELEWIEGGVAYLKTWKADGEKLQLTATDIFDLMDGMYYHGKMYVNGITAYDLAEDVLLDAGIADYDIDSYLKDVIIYNPVPVCMHKEALQLIANAGRCTLEQDRKGHIAIRSYFVPDIYVSSDCAETYCDLPSTLSNTEKEHYAAYSNGLDRADGTLYFLPRVAANQRITTGFVSRQVSGSDGRFEENPKLYLVFEAAYSFFGLNPVFWPDVPEEFRIRTYLEGEAVQEFLVTDLQKLAGAEFLRMDTIEIEIVKVEPYARACVDYIGIGDSTDYTITYEWDTIGKPTAERLQKVKDVSVRRTSWKRGNEREQILSETILLSENQQYMFTWDTPADDLRVTCSGGNAEIIEEYAYCAVVLVSGTIGTEVELEITGMTYSESVSNHRINLNPTGTSENWNNPLISTASNASDVAKWLGEYFLTEVDYKIPYRGEPRLDAGDNPFMESRFVEEMRMKIYRHTLNFNGGWSGELNGRR